MRKTEQVHAGIFFFFVASQCKGGSQDLFITCPILEEDDPYVADRRLDVFNEQFEQAWMALEDQGHSSITYHEIYPHPFLPTC